MDNLDSIKNYIDKNNLNVYGIVINEDGKENAYYYNNIRTNIYSIGKSITALCIFKLNDLDLINFDDKMVSFFPEFSYSKGSENITIQNLLDMRSGKDVSYVGEIPTDDEDFLQRFFDYPVELSNDKFRYSNSCSYVLGRIVTKITGQVLLDFANDNIFKPLDIQSPRWTTCNLGYTLCAHHIWLNVDELSKIGELLRNKGSFNGKEIINCKHFDKFSQEFSIGIDKLQYKNSFWNFDYENGYFMKGIYGNILVNIPKDNTTIAITANECDKAKYEALCDFVAEHFNESC